MFDLYGNPVGIRDPLAGTPLGEHEPGGAQLGSHTPPYVVDPSLETPDGQFEYLVGYLEQADAQAPSPYTATPPWGEPIPEDQTMPPAVQAEHYVIPPDFDQVPDSVLADPLARVRDPFPQEYPNPYMEPDDQYFGLGVPPGVQNLDQPVESGHTQIIRQNPAAEQGWDAWTGRPVLARVARMFNDFPGYNASQSRGHEVVPEKLEANYWAGTQQARDLLLVELKRRGIHNVVVADVPSVPYTEQVAIVQPEDLTPESFIGPEGIVPEDHYYGVGNLAGEGLAA